MALTDVPTSYRVTDWGSPHSRPPREDRSPPSGNIKVCPGCEKPRTTRSPDERQHAGGDGGPAPA